jgi:hypothetical protein
MIKIIGFLILAFTCLLVYFPPLSEGIPLYGKNDIVFLANLIDNYVVSSKKNRLSTSTLQNVGP